MPDPTEPQDDNYEQDPNYLQEHKQDDDQPGLDLVDLENRLAAALIAQREVITDLHARSPHLGEELTRAAGVAQQIDEARALISQRISMSPDARPHSFISGIPVADVQDDVRSGDDPEALTTK